MTFPPIGENLPVALRFLMILGGKSRKVHFAAKLTEGEKSVALPLEFPKKHKCHFWKTCIFTPGEPCICNIVDEAGLRLGLVTLQLGFSSAL